MKKKHKEYLMIPIANIKRKDNASVLTNNNVLTSHQKLILKISIGNNNHLGDAYELITQKPFYFKSSLLKYLYKGNYSDMISIESEDLIINIHPEFVNIDEVKTFLDEIIECNEARNYEELISDILLNKEKKYVREKKH